VSGRLTLALPGHRVLRRRLGILLLPAILLVPDLAQAAAPAGQWWNAAYTQRQNITVTAGTTLIPTQYSVPFTLDHARLVATGQSLVSGNDVRVVYWNGGGWVELDRRLDDQSAWNNARTQIWFRTQLAIAVGATDDNYYVYYANPGAGAPPTNWANVFLFYDDFNDGVFDAARWTCVDPLNTTPPAVCTESAAAPGTLSLQSDSAAWAAAGYAFGGDTRWESRLRLATATAASGAYNYWGADDGTTYPVAYASDWTTFWTDLQHWLNTANNGSQGNTTPSPAIGTPTSYHVYTLDREGTTGVRFFQDGTQVGFRNTNIPDANLRVAVWNDTGAANGMVYDWVRIRKYVRPEPQAVARRETATLNGSCMVTTDLGGGTDAARGIVLQPDGKIVLGGDGYIDWSTDFAAVRYASDFRVDTTFGAAGIASTNIDFDDESWGIALQSDLKIVMGGRDRLNYCCGDDDFAVLRYNSNGSLDTAGFDPTGAFGDVVKRPGITDTQMDTLWDIGRPMVLQPDGKILLAGPVRIGGGGGQYDFGIARYNTNGSLDTATFGGGTGKVKTPVGPGDDYANAILVQADGKIVIVGASVTATDYDFSLVRYNANGTLDGTFGAGGKVVTDLRGGLDWAAAAVLQPDGKFVVAGGSSNGSNTDFAVVRYNSNGTLDTSFGTGGMTFTPIGPGDDDAGALALQPDGKIVLAGSASNGTDNDFALVRYNSDGTIDTSFGFSGKVTTPIGGGDDIARAVVLQPDGRIVAAGESYNTANQDSDFAMVRYNPDGSLDYGCGQVSYSVGTNAGDLKTGSPTITIVSGTATLSVAQANDMGVGDVIDHDVDNKKVFVSGVISPTQFRVQTGNGGLPLDVTGVGVNSIKRAFNSVAAAVAGSSDANHLGGSNLVTAQKGLAWVCYDDGPLNVSATTNIAGYTTDAGHYLTLTVAGTSQVATRRSQRHRGIAGTGTVVEAGAIGGDQPVFQISQAYTRFEWLEIDGNSFVSQDGIYVTGANVLLRYLIVHDIGANDAANCPNGSNGCSAIILDTTATGAQVRNSIVYDYGQDGIDSGGTGVKIANTTIFRSKQTGEGIQLFGGTATAENVLSMGNSPDFCAQDFCSGTLTANNNISSDDSADNYGGAGHLINRAPANQFQSLVGTPNLHLRSGADAIDAGKSLATSFNDDVDGQARPQGAAWDVGADETFFAAARTLYRSIGTAASFVNQGTITITAGSATVTKSGGLGWKSQNRGRGDVLIAGGNNYIIEGVISDDALTLSTLPTVGYSGSTYTIARQFSTLAAWADCVNGPPGVACPYFPVASTSLVADDRSEVGIAYKDSKFTPPVAGQPIVQIGDTTTDAGHTIVLTADPGNRHHGKAWDEVAFPGAPPHVVLDNTGNSVDAIVVRDEFVTLEWLEIKGNSGGNDGMESQSVGVPAQLVFRNLIVHDIPGGDGLRLTHGDTQADIYDNVVYKVSRGIRINAALTGGFPVRVFNNTVYLCTGAGIGSAAGSFPTVTLRNNLAHSNAAASDFAVGGVNAASSNNLSGDATATAASPGGGAQASVPLSGAGGVNFVSTTSGSEDLHLQGTSQAINGGVNLSTVFSWDIDGDTRSATWDLGADEFGATTAVTLMSFEATGEDGAARLGWRTGSELDNLGFNLYRGPSADGPWTRLTSSLIPGLGSSALGQSYEWLDAGLVNGTRYFYRLEDVDTASVTTSHGPVSAVPQAPSAPDGDGGGGGDSPGGSEGAPASCPPSVLAALGATPGDGSTCARYGNPEAGSFSVLAHDPASATVELRTGGFWSLREASGTIRAFIPGLDTPSDPGAPALPVRRALVDAVVGRKVELTSVELLDLRTFDGLRPSAVGSVEMDVRADGTVRPARRRRARPAAAGDALAPAARLVGTVFQGEQKSAVVEITPLRYQPRGQDLVLAGRVVVHLAFAGSEPDELGSGGAGRPSRARTPLLDVLARIHTTQRGVYSVSFEDLFPQRRRPLDVAFLRLQRQGVAAAFHVEPRSRSFGPGSRLVFYADAVASSTAWSPEVVWELVHSAAGVSMETASAVPEGPVVSTSMTATDSFETNRLYEPGLLEAPDVWLWDFAVGSGPARRFSFTLAGLDSAGASSATLDLQLQGGSESGVTADHHVRVAVGHGDPLTPVGEATFAGKAPFHLTLSVPVALLQEGDNTLEITDVGDTGVYSLVYLDRFAVTYPRQPVLAGGRLEVACGETGTYEVSGVSSPAAVLDVTAANSAEGGPARWLSGFEEGGGGLRFQAEAGHRYAVVGADGLLKAAVTAPAPGTLLDPQNQADYVLIAPRAFMDAAQPLLLRRQSQRLSTRAASLEEIGDSFGHGQPSAEAIREFLRFAYHDWAPPAPRYVLLLGDATYDPQHFLASSWASPLPALWTRTSYLWTASDPALAAVNGDDLLPDMAIGRLPATTVAEAEELVAKTLAWEDSGQGLSGLAVLVADDPDGGGDFEGDVEDIRSSFLDDRPTRTLEVRTLQGATRDAILSAFDDGPGLVSYVGHGGAAVWASENVFNSWDVDLLRPQSFQPLLLTMNCLNGYFVAPNYDALPEALLKAPGRGIVAALSPSGLSLDGPAHEYHRDLVAELTSGSHARLGDAVLAAQSVYAHSGLLPELLAVYNLLGDPALLIR
jgi:uncharacterized delta-60 repeat protein